MTRNVMIKMFALFFAVATITVVAPARFFAQSKSAEMAASAVEACPAHEIESSVTHHHLGTGARSFDYTATAGMLIVRDDDDKPIAKIGYIAYTRDDRGDATQRPILFAFNGGPGSSSVWLHMGLLGPKRVVVADSGPTPPAPFKMVDNEFSMLDKTDIVMIDPVSTGLSRAICGRKDSDFWNVDADVDSVSRFIAQYVSDNNRWTSPKYLMGESYGTTRAASVVNYLRVHRSLTFNGLVLVSMATDMELIFTEIPGNERPYAMYLPAFAAVAWYYHKVPGPQVPLEPFLDEVRRYANGPFVSALLQGNALSDDQRHAVAEQVAKYTGLSPDYVEAANLRISEFAFAQELLKSQHKTISRLDATFTGVTQDSQQKIVDYDPLLSDVGPAFTAAFQDYYHRDLKFGVGQTYKVMNSDISEHWDYSHKPIGVDGEPQTLVNSGVDLAQTIVQDPNMKVLVLSGYFDLGSPFTSAEYMVSHLPIPRELVSRIQIKYYDAGHMIYINLPSLKSMKQDIDSFVDSTH
ncbi:MAG: peptidase S10 [Terracidiphilus sp.]|jgi:carboxypeptidase C (cathepsin A)